MKRLLVPAMAVLFLACCAGAPRVVSYYVDRGVMQYFLMPSRFHAGDAGLSIDFAIRVEADQGEPAICNFTIKVKKDLPRAIRRAYFRLLDTGGEVELHAIAVLFIERLDKEIRITSTMEAADFRRLLHSREVTLSVESDAGEYTFNPARGFYNTIRDAGIEIIDES
jgi:hypothetical protein